MQTSQSLIGKLGTSGATARIDYREAIEAVDELVAPSSSLSEYVAPGLIDLQVNGFAGVDYNEPSSSAEAIARSVRTMFTTGVTRFFPTLITGPETRIVAALKNLVRTKEELLRNGMAEGLALEAFHIEGPHLSPETGPRGAHPLEFIRPPDVAEFERWQEAAQGQIRLVTISPEWDGAAAYIAKITRLGVVASVGHTTASTVQIQAAVEAGATLSTHLGNAAHPVLPKTDNYIWDQLAESRLAACFIVDGIHIPPPFFRAATRAKGVENSILVSDAVMPAMCTPGAYQLGQVAVELHADGRVTLQGADRLAGSALRMDRAVENALRFGDLSLAGAVAMATTNPARLGRIEGRRRGLAPGEKADLIRFRYEAGSQTFSVTETVVGGISVYSE